MFAEPFETTIPGVVDRIDDGLARVFIGEDNDEWFFPMPTLPDGAELGSEVLFSLHNGRYAAVSLARAGRESERSITDRLNRPMNLRRTGEMRRVELQAALRVSG